MRHFVFDGSKNTEKQNTKSLPLTNSNVEIMQTKYQGTSFQEYNVGILKWDKENNCATRITALTEPHNEPLNGDMQQTKI